MRRRPPLDRVVSSGCVLLVPRYSILILAFWSFILILRQDFDLCETCRETVAHEHPMEQIKPLIGAESGEAGGNNRFESIQVCLFLI